MFLCNNLLLPGDPDPMSSRVKSDLIFSRVKQITHSVVHLHMYSVQGLRVTLTMTCKACPICPM